DGSLDRAGRQRAAERHDRGGDGGASHDTDQGHRPGGPIRSGSLDGGGSAGAELGGVPPQPVLRRQRTTAVALVVVVPVGSGHGREGSHGLRRGGRGRRTMTGMQSSPTAPADSDDWVALTGADLPVTAASTFVARP